MDNFQKVYDEIEAEEFDKVKMIEEYEVIYGMDTKKFRSQFEQNNHEGNSDEQIWYLISR